MNGIATSQSQQPDLLLNWRRFIAWVSENGWEIAIAIGVGVTVALALIGVRGLVRRLLGGTEATGWRKVLEGMAARTYLFFIVAASAKIVSEQAVMPRRLADAIDFLFIVAAALQVAIWTRAFIVGAIERRIGEDEKGRSLGTAMGLIRVLVTVAAFLIAIIVILDNVGVNVTGLIAGLGVGGIAIGLAAQGIFKDLFAALAIIFDRPFRKGDSIQVGGANAFTGTVENIGLRTTRLRSLDGEMISIGNDKLLQDRVHNFALQGRRRVLMTIQLAPHTSADALDKLPKEVAAVVATEPLATFDRAHVVRFGPASIDLELLFHVEDADFAAFMQARHDVNVALIRRLAELKVDFVPPAAPATPAPAPPQLAKS
jgi:small-conductance mechanosensitive channel